MQWILLCSLLVAGPTNRYAHDGWRKFSVVQRRANASGLSWEEVDALPASEMTNEEMARWSELSTDRREGRVEDPKRRKQRGHKGEVAEEITADQLVAHYLVNEVAADNRFRGRTILVTGEVEQVGKGFFDDVFVLIDSGRGQSVHCAMGRNVQTEIASLHPGQRIRVKGRVTGLTLGSPLLSNCTLETYWR